METGLAKTGTTILFASIRHGFPRKQLIVRGARDQFEIVNSRVAESMLALEYPVISSIENPMPIPVATTLEYVEQLLPGEP